MIRLKRRVVIPVLLAVLIINGGWGFLVHRTIHQLAIYELPQGMRPFFYKNMESIVTHAVRPDLRRSNDSAEAARHFIDLEMYGYPASVHMPAQWPEAIRRYSKDSLLKYGYVSYHIIYMKEKLTQAFRKGQKDSILFYATDIGHYIGDANVPLHTTINYDGQLTNQRGLHSLWESMIPEMEIGNYQLYSGHKATYLRNPYEALWNSVKRSYALVPDLLEKEREISKGFTEAEKYRVQIRRGRESKSYTSKFAKAYAKALKHTINDQLLHSVNLIADFWYTSWVDAGSPDLSVMTSAWTDTDEQNFEAQQTAFRKNELLHKGLLLAKKAERRRKGN